MHPVTKHMLKRRASTELELIMPHASRLSKPNQEVPTSVSPEDHQQLSSQHKEHTHQVVPSTSTSHFSWNDCEPSTSGTSSNHSSSTSPTSYDSDSDESYTDEVPYWKISSGDRYWQNNHAASNKFHRSADKENPERCNHDSSDYDDEEPKTTKPASHYTDMWDTIFNSAYKNLCSHRRATILFSKPTKCPDDCCGPAAISCRKPLQQLMARIDKYGVANYNQHNYDSTDDENSSARTIRKPSVKRKTKRTAKRVQFAPTHVEQRIKQYADKLDYCPSTSSGNSNIENQIPYSVDTKTHLPNCLDIYLPDFSNCNCSLQDCGLPPPSCCTTISDNIEHLFLDKIKILEFLGLELPDTDSDLKDTLRQLRRQDSQWSATSAAIRERQQRRLDNSSDEDDFHYEDRKYRIPFLKKGLQNLEAKHPLFYLDEDNSSMDEFNDGEDEDDDVYDNRVDHNENNSESESDSAINDHGYSSDGWRTCDDENLTEEDD